MKFINSDFKIVWLISIFLITFFIFKLYETTENHKFDSAKIHPASIILHKQI
jgi:hypothetical protein